MFPEKLKYATITPIFKKGDQTLIENFRPISILPVISKIFERTLYDQIERFFDEKFSIYLCGFRKGYNTQYALSHLIYKWQKCLDQSGIVGTILTDLSKAYDVLPHDLLIAKLEAYGLDRNSLKLIYDYLQNRKQRVKINDKFSTWLSIILGVPQGSILGPILFNIFINDLFMFIKETHICNFADDNTIYACEKTLKETLQKLRLDLENTIKWFNTNQMVANPDKFQFMILGNKPKTNVTIKIKDIELKSVDKVKLLGVYIDSNLNFSAHIKSCAKTANNRTNALIRIRKYIDTKTAKLYANAFILPAFSYCPLIWMFCNKNLNGKIDKAHKRCLKAVYNLHHRTFKELLYIDKSSNLHTKNLKSLMTEIYKVINNLAPEFMTEIFTIKNQPYNLRRTELLNLPPCSTRTFGTNSLSFRASYVWNNLPINITSAKTLSLFKILIKKWQRVTCNCKICA